MVRNVLVMVEKSRTQNIVVKTNDFMFFVATNQLYKIVLIHKA